jgi:hypothetical protein
MSYFRLHALCANEDVYSTNNQGAVYAILECESHAYAF